jgi:hypothetical protein
LTLTGSDMNHNHIHNNNVMMQNTIYALTSIIERHPICARYYFLGMGASITLGHYLLDQSSLKSSKLSISITQTKHKHDMKLVTKIVTLAQDDLMEISYATYQSVCKISMA